MEVILRLATGKPHKVAMDRPRLVIGRGDDCDLVLESPLISRHHCALTIQDGRVFARDLGSTNGTGLNNRTLVGEEQLRDGDVLWVAATGIEVCICSRQGAAITKANAVTLSEAPSAPLVNIGD